MCVSESLGGSWHQRLTSCRGKLAYACLHGGVGCITILLSRPHFSLHLHILCWGLTFSQEMHLVGWLPIKYASGSYTCTFLLPPTHPLPPWLPGSLLVAQVTGRRWIYWEMTMTQSFTRSLIAMCGQVSSHLKLCVYWRNLKRLKSELPQSEIRIAQLS